MAWFPRLPTYANFNARLNAMGSAVMALVPLVLQSTEFQNNPENLSELMILTDSLPVMLCSGKRQGRVAPELSDKGYCASKGVYYYGVKLHVMARRVKGSIPFVQMAGLTPASENDLAVFKPVADHMAGQAVFADKAYADKPLNERLMELQNTFIYTPVKLVKGESEWERNFVKAADGLWSTAVSRIRQPIGNPYPALTYEYQRRNCQKLAASLHRYPRRRIW